MLKYFYSLFLCYFLLIFSCLCYATEQSKLEEAIKYYDSGEYKRSIAVYNELLDKNFTSGSLYYNLGNAYFRDKQIGNAVASYLAARFKLPRNPDIKENLKYSLLQVPDNLDDKLAPSLWSVLDFWSAYLTSVELLSFALLLWSLGFLCLFILNFFPKLILFRKLAWPLITLSLPLFFIFQISYLNHKEWGCIVSKVATALHTMGLQGGYRISKWHLDFMKVVRSPMALKLTRTNTQDIEEAHVMYVYLLSLNEC